MQLCFVLIASAVVSCFKIAMSSQPQLYMTNLGGQLVMSNREIPAEFVQEDRDPGSSYLKIVASGYTMDILNGKTDLVFAKFHGRGHQIFSLARSEDGSFYIKSIDNRCVEVRENSKVIAAPCRSVPEQKFDVVKYPTDDYSKAWGSHFGRQKSPPLPYSNFSYSQSWSR